MAWAIVVYGFAASVLPVWLLLAPRDYLSTFMKLGTIVALAAGVLLVPLLTHYALAAVLLIALLLYLLMQQSMAGKGAAAMLLIMAITDVALKAKMSPAWPMAKAIRRKRGTPIGTVMQRACNTVPVSTPRRVEA